STSYFIKLDDSIASSFKAFDVVYYGTFIGTGASSIYGVWSIITSSLTPINEKLEKLDAKLDASEARLEARIGKLDEKVEKLDAN
ncbi:36145_t:CDS:2, partial [Gigaspora margarita]